MENNKKMFKFGELGECIQQLKSGDKQVREKLITYYVPIITDLVKRKYDGDEELLSYGFIGMIKAVDAYTADNHQHLTSKVIVYATKEINRFLEKCNRRNNVKILSDVSIGDVFVEYEQKEFYDKLRKAVEMLPEPECGVIKLYHGIDCGRPHAQEEIGEMLDLSKSRINQIVKKAHDEIYNILNLEPIKKFEKTGRTVPFYRLFDGYRSEQVNDVLFNMESEQIALIKYLYHDQYDIAITRWNKLDSKSRIDFYKLVDDIRIRLKNENYSQKVFTLNN